MKNVLSEDTQSVAHRATRLIEAFVFGLSLLSMLALILAPHRIGLGF